MNLTDNTQQNIQPRLDYSPTPTGEAREAGRAETESSEATNGLESPASTDRLMEEVCERDNLKEALRRVKANKGSAGVDGMTIGGLTAGQKSAEGILGYDVGKASEALHMPKGGATDRPNRERWLKARTRRSGR